MSIFTEQKWVGAIGVGLIMLVICLCVCVSLKFHRRIQDRRAGRAPPGLKKNWGCFCKFDCITRLYFDLFNIQLLLQKHRVCVKYHQNKPLT